MSDSKERTDRRSVFVGLTGGSGHAYAERLIVELVRLGCDVSLSITPAGAKVLRHELGVEAGVAGELLPAALVGWLGSEIAPHVRAFASEAVEAPPSSGTSLTGGVVLCPCSMGTLARVAVGFSSNLVERAADVALKERRNLILVPRETPLSEVHLENMLRLARMGATILPAMPGFYHRPRDLDDLVGHVVGKILDRLGLAHGVGARWRGLPDEPADPAGFDPPAPLEFGDGRRP
ncbi:UbiX family flavin prenyltransferase [Engelhardtia mirabilis]|uniref:Flavin prenyltransferase UbiX n=1 Tax=Engelhardtia mirabilis TaxID=2528011 RepID=A0A518BJ96_9BACT|nr:putative aromatic acid decarboxylase [Planctomycetes bacterium Pla133]QDV01377.1 putative aromatic acid decarboxylase [Planctomycetes bacterium Pla86]